MMRVNVTLITYSNVAIVRECHLPAAKNRTITHPDAWASSNVKKALRAIVDV